MNKDWPFPPPTDYPIMDRAKLMAAATRIEQAKERKKRVNNTARRVR